MSRSQHEELVLPILNNLTSLIVHHATCMASEQYLPKMNPDDSDEYLEEKKHWISELRSIRERLENLTTGVIL